MYIEYKVEIQIREKWGRRRKAPSKAPTKLARRRRHHEAGATKIAAMEATTWLNCGVESIGTLNLGFRRSWRDKDRETELARQSWHDGDDAAELARRRSLQRRLVHGLIAERNRLAL